MVEILKIMATSFKRSHACTAAHSAPNLAAGHHPPTPLLETPGHSRASLCQSLVGSLLLSPGSWCAQGFVCALQESVSQSFVSSGGSMVGLMTTSSKRAYAIPRYPALRAPAATAVHWWPVPPQETLKHSSVSASVGLAVYFSEMYFIILRKFPSIPCLWTFSFYFLINKECSI